MLELKSTISEMKKSLEGFKADWRDIRKNQQTWRWVNSDYLVWGTERKKYGEVNRCIMGFSKGEEKKEEKNIWRNNDWKLPKFGKKNMNLDIQRDQCTPKRINTERITLRHIVKLFKDKEKNRILKAAREKQLII